MYRDINESERAVFAEYSGYIIYVIQAMLIIIEPMRKGNPRNDSYDAPMSTCRCWGVELSVLFLLDNQLTSWHALIGKYLLNTTHISWLSLLLHSLPAAEFSSIQNPSYVTRIFGLCRALDLTP